MKNSRHHIVANSIPQDLLEAQRCVYAPCGFQSSQPIMGSESAEYGACAFRLNNFSVLFRVAKITPTKIGQFVTLWKRIGNGPIQPYDISDLVDFFIVSTRKDNHFGQFVFPKSVLYAQRVLSIKGKGGKRAIRVYPPWDKTSSRQAKKTQQWQMEYFLKIPQNGKIDRVKAQMLYSLGF